MKNDSLGDRMKKNYEDRTRFYLPRRTYTIIRVDGKAFHSFCSKLEKPFDWKLIATFQETTRIVGSEMQGFQFAYGQSDEVSFLVTDFNEITTEAWFDGNIQKIASVTASLFTAQFNNLFKYIRLASFDCRVFSIAERTEVENYFIWRQQDATRNSVQMLGRSKFSHKELDGKNCSEIQEMLHNKYSINWNDQHPELKRGWIVTKDSVLSSDHFVCGCDLFDAYIPRYS